MGIALTVAVMDTSITIVIHVPTTILVTRLVRFLNVILRICVVWMWVDRRTYVNVKMCENVEVWICVERNWAIKKLIWLQRGIAIARII